VFVPNTLAMGIAFILNINLLSTGDGFGGNNVTLPEKEWPSRVAVLICCCGGFTAGEGLGGLGGALSQAAQGLGATTGLQWDVQTLTTGADAIEEIPFRQARRNYSYNQPCFVII
jgi:hypothetical protein